LLSAVFSVLLCSSSVLASEAPDWMHALVATPLPAHDEKTNAVILYTDTILSVSANGRIKRLERMAVRILRPDGEKWGVVKVNFDAQSPITTLRAWCIPATGKDFQVKEKDAVESVLPGVQNGELMSDVRAKFLRIPAATPGSIVGYEYEQEQKPYFMEDDWDFQDTVPVVESRYTLQLPPGWSYKSLWINHAEIQPVNVGPGQWRWSATDQPAVAIERRMPPWRGVAARMAVALLPPGQSGLLTWQQLGDWHLNLLRDRLAVSPEIKQRVAELTAGVPTLLGKMRALAQFVQTDIRYVAIELGIGGYQPHPAAEVFAHRYGDCKDKVTLLKAMLGEIGVESQLVLINTVRGTVTPATPPNLAFDHAIAAILLPAALTDPSLQAIVNHKTLGKLLYFDPTDSLTPLGSLSGGLQGDYALLTSASLSELVLLPQLAVDTNSLSRTVRVTLDEQGALRGDFTEVYLGDLAATERARLRAATTEADRIKPVEERAAESLSNFAVQKVGPENLNDNDKPFAWRYSLEASKYAKVSADLMMVRPRILDVWSSGLLETREARRHPVEFDGPERRSDSVEIALPPGYAVDELPPPINAEYSFGTYRSNVESIANSLRYTRTLEIRQLSVPAADAEQLRKFYRVIATDERRAAVLKRIAVQ
jgi:transglutaminase-like putative cysteine protease